LVRNAGIAHPAVQNRQLTEGETYADHGVQQSHRRSRSECRSREHFLTHTNLNDDRPWVPYASGVWIQPCCFNVTSGRLSVLLKGLPGAKLGVHYHVGTVRGFTLRGHWRYLEHDWIAKPGTFIYEPAGEAHTLVVTDDSPEPALIFFCVEGCLIYLDKAVDGGFGAYEDGSPPSSSVGSTIAKPVWTPANWTC
jgi:hypothetical protein